MGTGSHRPQWEAAKGRADVRGGIRHARALPSHTQLKFRPERKRAAPARRSIAAAPGTGAGAEPRSHHSVLPHSPPHAAPAASMKACRDAKDELPSADDESDGSDSDAELRRELDLINKRQALIAQREARRAPEPKSVASWRSEAVFKSSKPTQPRASRSGSNALKKAEHHDFMDKYLK